MGTWDPRIWGTWGGTGVWGTKEEMWGPGTCGAARGVYGVMWGLRMWGNTWGGTEMWGSTGGDVGTWDVWGGTWEWDTWGPGTTDMGHVGWHWDVGHKGNVRTWDVWGGTGTWVALVAP